MSKVLLISICQLSITSKPVCLRQKLKPLIIKTFIRFFLFHLFCQVLFAPKLSELLRTFFFFCSVWKQIRFSKLFHYLRINNIVDKFLSTLVKRVVRIAQLTFHFSAFPTLDIATYNCPWLNICVGRKIPTRLRVWPCDLLAVNAKNCRIGNCLRFIVKGKTLPDGDITMRGMKRVFPLCEPQATTASTTFALADFTTYLVPLQCPCAESKLRRSIIGEPILIFNSCGGNPGGFSLLWNSVGSLEKNEKWGSKIVEGEK